MQRMLVGCVVVCAPFILSEARGNFFFGRRSAPVVSMYCPYPTTVGYLSPPVFVPVCPEDFAPFMMPPTMVPPPGAYAPAPAPAPSYAQPTPAPPSGSSPPPARPTPPPPQDTGGNLQYVPTPPTAGGSSTGGGPPPAVREGSSGIPETAPPPVPPPADTGTPPPGSGSFTLPPTMGPEPRESQSNKPPTVRESRYFDAYSVATRAAGADDGLSSVTLRNLSDRDLSVMIGTTARLLLRGQTTTVRVRTPFVWQIGGRAPETQRVERAGMPLEIVIRR